MEESRAERQREQVSIGFDKTAVQVSGDHARGLSYTLNNISSQRHGGRTVDPAGTGRDPKLPEGGEQDLVLREPADER
jgi:hypothetical protein